MASPSERIYFPALEDCLKGDRILLSWELLAAAFADSSCARLVDESVAEFIQDAYVLQLVKDPAKVFEPASLQTKSDFETKTAAIHVTPTPNEKYDVKAIKEDALWLSQNTGISEVAALRLIVVEFQSRAQSHLTGSLTTQDAVSLQEAAGVNNAQASNVLASLQSSATLDAEAVWATFETTENKRRRFLSTYFSERRYFAMCADYLVSFMLHGKRPVAVTVSAADPLRRTVAQAAWGWTENSGPQTRTPQPILEKYMGLVPNLIERSQTSVRSVVKDESCWTEELELDWIRVVLVETLHVLTVAFQILDLPDTEGAAPEVVKQWFETMAMCAFLDGLQPYNDAISELILPLQSMVCVVTLKLLDLEKAIGFFDKEIDLEDTYLRSPDVLKVIHETIMAAAGAHLATTTPVAFSWSLLLHRMSMSYQERAERRDLLQNQRAQDGFELDYQPGPGAGRRNSAGSIVSIEAAAYDGFLVEFSLERDLQTVEALAMSATAGGELYIAMTEMNSCMTDTYSSCFRPAVGCRMRLVFMDLLKASYPIVGYLTEPMSTLLSVLSGDRRYWDLSSESDVLPSQDITALALQDADLLRFYVYQALNRYPYEFTPFVALCRTLATCQCTDERSEIVLKSLMKTPSLTFTLPDGFQAYELIAEEENTNSLRILANIPLFTAGSNWKRRQLDGEPFIIPAGTTGRLVSDDGLVVYMNYEHSTLALLGKRLEADVAGDPYSLLLGPLAPEETAESISLLATLIRVETLKASANADTQDVHDAGLSILQEASRGLPNTKDIISVVCDSFDNVLQADLASSGPADLALLTACVEFFHAILPICPGRIWSYMARTELLTTQSRAGRLSRITGNLDMVLGRFDFLTSSVQFLSTLIDSAMTSAVQRKAGAKMNSRQKGGDSVWLGTSDKILAQVCLSIAQTAVDVFENSSTWRFTSEIHRSMLVRDVVPIMNKLVLYTFSVGDPESSSTGLTVCLEPAAGYIIDSFLASSGSLRFQPMLATLIAAFELPGSTFYTRRKAIISERLVAVLDLATSLLKVANFLGRDSSTLEAQLFKTASLLARLCAVDSSYKTPAFSLLGALISSASKAAGEPPSLLGYLGPQISRSFIQLLLRLDKPFNRPSECAGIWKFFSNIIRNRQQWMANCLLTGKTPRDALKGDGKLSKLSEDSVLNAALERLSRISTMASSEALSVLDLFTSAQNYWPWTIIAMQDDNSFLTHLRAYVHELKPSSVTVKSDAGRAGNEARIAAYIAETFAMQLYHLRQLGREEAFAQDLVNDLDYYLRDGVTVSGYNSSLHANFTKNFASRYPGCALANFKRTMLAPQDLGRKYYYALEYAGRMMDFDPGWVGKRGNGFRNEMETANLNLSLVDSQIALYHAWEFLLLELSLCLLPKNQRISKQMLQVAEQCLTSNGNAQGPERIFERITQSRADLCLTLVQRLADSSQLPADISHLLSILWTTIHGVENPFGDDQIQYYRSLLKTLFVLLRGCAQAGAAAGGGGGDDRNATANGPIVAVMQNVLNVLDHVVAQGFRALVNLVHDAEGHASPEDLALITAILQACLCVPGIDECQTQVLNIMASHDVLHVATSLFSWADKLAEKGDPLYGELSLLFLLELSTLPVIAEQLACEGLLGHLTSVNLAAHMRRPNIGPLAENAGAQRCYGIWVKGVLPLLLNVLMALGATIAPEVAYVLNQFPNLLQSSVERFEAPGMSRTASLSRGGGGAHQQQHHVVLLCVSEVHSLAVLTRVIGVLRLGNGRDIPEVKWEAGPLLESVEFWLSRPKVLRERLQPLGAREAEWRNRKSAAAGCENVLEEKVVAQLEAVKAILSDEADE